jgi:negative regulator of replication initiation
MMPARRVARRTSRRTSRRMSAAQEQTSAAAPAPAAPAQAAPAQQDDMAEIQQLAAMKDQGILTEEEFQAKKKQILGI